MMGLIGTTIALIVGFIPPTNINVGGAFHFEVIFITGLICAILPVILLYLYRWRYR
jgi:hypothetical protein